MIIKIDRKYKKRDYTIGLLFIDGQFYCNTLEDQDLGLTSDMKLEDIKRIKQFGKTAIPTGTYEVDITYSPKFKKDMPLIRNVKGFDGIRIHAGQNASQTQGCVLLGKNDKVGQLSNSRLITNQFYALLEGAIKNNEKITLIIQ